MRNSSCLSELNRPKMFPNLYGEMKNDFEALQQRGDWKLTESIICKGKEHIWNEIEKSELRGRSGGGNYSYAKWKEMENQRNPKFFIVNGNETEPGACKDRLILYNEPFKIIEGAFLTSYAHNIHHSYIFVRGNYIKEAKMIEKAIQKLQHEGFIGENNKFNYPFTINVHRCAGSYVCGEQTGLMNCIEGKRGRPRPKPPRPFESGLWRQPTLVHNAETTSAIATILRHGHEWFSKQGVPGSKGPKIYGISGNVNNPCVFEAEMGLKLRDIIEQQAGGVVGGWDNALGVIPGGLSTKILTKQEAEHAVMGFDQMAKLGSSLGTACAIVIDKNMDLAELLVKITSFFEQECCGRCDRCVDGTKKLNEISNKILDGKGKKEDLDELVKTAKAIPPLACSFAFAASDSVIALIEKYYDYFLKRI